MKTVQYWGAGNIHEGQITGKSRLWYTGMSCEVEDNDATSLLAYSSDFRLDQAEDIKKDNVVTATTNPLTGRSELPADLLTASRVVTENRIGHDFVTVTASRNVKAQRCKLYCFEVISGSAITVALTDNADSGGLAVATYAGLNAGDRIPFPAGLDFYDGLYATITGTATIQFEVI